ncbi:MAG TPA: PilN domain-containing protein [Gemmatimonadales bacterium]
MITINLRPGQKRKRAGNPLKDVGERFRALGTRVRDPLLIGAAAVWVIVAGFLAVSWFMTQRELSALEPRIEQARAEHTRFKTFLAQKRKQELIRDSLVAQIGVIRSVDGDRYVWPHILDEIARALPAYTWLTNVAVEAANVVNTAVTDTTAVDTAPPALQFRVEGRTVDMQAYTRFLRQLESSPWIEEVMAVEAKTVVEKERPVTAFTIRATFTRADSAYIRTVPLSESVR